MTTDPRQYCLACDSGTTYWTFSSVDGAAGASGRFEVWEMIKERHGDG